MESDSQTDVNDICRAPSGNIPDFSNIISGGIESGLHMMCELDTDGDAAARPEYLLPRGAGHQKVQKVMEKHESQTVKDTCDDCVKENIFSFDNDNSDLTKKICEIKKTLTNNDERTATKTCNSLSNDFPLTGAHLVQAGVSEQYFNNLVKELRMTKGLLTDLLQRQDISVKDAVTWKQNRDQQTQIRYLSAENEEIKKECIDLQHKVEKVHSELCMYKLILRKFKEGETVHLTDKTQPERTSEKFPSADSVVNSSTGFNVQNDSSGPETKSGSVTDAKNFSKTEANQKLTDVQIQTLQQTNKELEEEVRRLEREVIQQKKCVGMALAECLRIKQEKDDVAENYRSLHSSIEELKKQRDDTFLHEHNKSLIKENILLKKELTSIQNDNLDYLAGIETLQNNLCREKDKNTELLKLLKEEKEKHNNMYVELKRKFDQASLENTQLRQQLPIVKGHDVYSSVSGFTSLPVRELQSMKMSYYDNQRRQPVESTVFGDCGQESAALFADGALFTCQHCFAEFNDETEFLTHFQKCLP